MKDYVAFVKDTDLRKVILLYAVKPNNTPIMLCQGMHHIQMKHVIRSP